MLCCGPIALVDRVENPDRAVAVFAVDGALRMDVIGASAAIETVSAAADRALSP
jgi:hypothetical protein